MHSTHTARALLCAALALAPAAMLAQALDSVPAPTRAQADSLYWQQRFTDARRAYEAALVAHPDDAELRLAYGQMLVETLAARRAREVLTPLVGNSAGRAELLLGTNAYWSDDYTTAHRFFVAALRADSTLAKARLQLYEIAAVTAPSVRIGATFMRDDQPLRRVGVAFGGEYFLFPSVRAWLRFEPTHFSVPHGSSPDVLRVEGGVSMYYARPRLEVDWANGQIGGSDPYHSPRIGRLAVGKRLPNHLVARVAAERDRYLYAVPSIDTTVLTWTGRASVTLREHRGWLGEAAVQRVWFPDHNAVSSAWLWFLAPISTHRLGDLKAGYAAGAQTADNNRFALARPDQQIPPVDPQYDLSGRYSPYYTPDHLMTHSALLAATTRLVPGMTLRTGASVGIFASDNAPMFVRPNGPPTSQAPARFARYKRTFTPWSARAALDVTRGRDWIVALTGDYQHTSFYSAGTAGLQLTRRFTGAAIRRADRY